MRFGVAFGLCIVILTMFAGERGLPAVFKARRQAHTLAREVGTLREQNQALRARVLALRNEPGTIETVARETLGLARPGEIVVLRRR
jgi:cell division protein FtsB